MTKNDNTITLFIKKLTKNAEALCKKLCHAALYSGFIGESVLSLF